ncbi:glycosyltransferase family 2 protein [Enterovirga sp.]|uniref:glycosyltransferase family 2 protein n=1 Tax=Enterovirga sp. TaxID=2026350 RepID=UPI00262812D4|nr:glycosyltransferase family 2 protein [Enterovirga sp.]
MNGSATLLGGAGRDLPLRREPDGLSVDLLGTGLGGRWVAITLREAPETGRTARRLMFLVGSDGRRLGPPLLEEALGAGRFGWTGRLPEDTSALHLVSLRSGDPAPVRIEIRRRGRAALIGRALGRDPALAARAVYWRILGKRMRGRGLLDRAVRHPRETGYAAWIRRNSTLREADRQRIRAEVAGWAAPPLISILMPVHNPAPAVLRVALRSVSAQLYPHWELCVTDDASTDPEVWRELERFARGEPRMRLVRRAENGHIARATNDALGLATGLYAAFMDHDDALPEQALYEVARVVREDPGLVLIYSDEDKLDSRGRRHDPHFKPGFDRERLYAQNYINHLTVIRTDRLRQLGGLRPGFEGSQDHDLLLRLTAGLRRDEIRHIPAVLYHWRAAPGSRTFSDRSASVAEAARLRALAEAAAPWGGRAETGHRGFNRLVRPLPEAPPLVSCIIPTRDRAELLGTVLEGLFGHTDYPAIEAVVVDNGSREPETARLFARYADDPRVRILPAPGPFNFSDLSNQGAAAASGSVLLFLNNDVEVIEPDWLAELVRQALEPETGAVGAKLLYPDGTIQHAGIVLGIGGVAGHADLGLPESDGGYFARLLLAQEVSAVTGACLAMRREVFAEVGGFDAEHLKIAFNDIDLCLRVREAGYRIVWTPFSRLIHHESKSRGPEDTPEKIARFQRETAVMQERWGARLQADPYYNPNLSRRSGHYRI